MATEYKLSYTAAQIDEKLNKIDSLVAQGELPTKTSDLINDSGFTTESYVQNYAQPIGDYALRSEIPDISVTSVNGHTGEVNLTASDVGALPDTTEIPTIPVDISAFYNDVGYLTEHQSLDGLATEIYVNNQISAAMGEAGQVAQPDWNAAEGENGHILNRPFYTEYSGMTEIPLTGEWSEVDPDMWQYLITAPIGLEVGKTYVVNWNGVDYTVVAKVIDDPSGAGVPYVGIGNEALIGGTDTGEPFGIMETTAEYAEQFGGMYGMAASIDMSGNIPFTIYANGEVVHKLPVKYLPEGLPYSEITNGGLIDTLTFDGDINSKPSIELEDGIYYVHMSNTFVDSEKLIGGEFTTISLMEGTPSDTVTITEDILRDMSEDFGIPAYRIDDFIVVLSQDFTMEGITLPKGINFLYASNMFYVSELKAPDAVFYGSGEIIHKLAGKYLPTGTPYIENEGVTEVVLPETTVTGLTKAGIQVDLQFSLKPLTNYIVTWNGIKYTVTSSETVSGDGFQYVGIGNVFILGSNDNVPFGIVDIMTEEGNAQMISSNDGTSEATFSIEIDKTIIHKIDERCLPDDANSNIINGSANGSARTINTKEIIGEQAFAEGYNTEASGDCSHAEGYETIASGFYSHAEGESTQAISRCAHAEGYYSKANNSGAHAEGHSTEASGSYSHAEGEWTTASGRYSHAEGYYSIASGEGSHAEGGGFTEERTVASGKYSHAEGQGIISASDFQHAQGKFNIADSIEVYAHIVGNGENDYTRSNAHTIDWNGNAWFAGDVYVGSTSGTNKDEGSKKLVAAPTDMSAGDLLMYDGTTFVKLSKADLIAEIIAALPRAEEANF